MSPSRKRIAVEMPPESRKSDVYEVGLLKKAMHGTRDAAMHWEAEIESLLVGSMGFVHGRRSPCNFYNKDRQLRVSAHGDDFTMLGSMLDLKWFVAGLRERRTITERGILVPPEIDGTTQEIPHLNRLFSWTREGVTWERDPRHVDLVIQRLGVTQKVTTPLTKERSEDAEMDDALLSEGETKLYLSMTGRIGYISHGRCDLQRKVRELAKGTAQPTEWHVMMLKRSGRYLPPVPRVVQRIPMQRTVTEWSTFCDAEHAGCIRSRKSTTGLEIMIGKCSAQNWLQKTGSECLVQCGI